MNGICPAVLVGVDSGGVKHPVGALNRLSELAFEVGIFMCFGQDVI